MVEDGLSPLVEGVSLRKEYPTRGQAGGGRFLAVNGASLAIRSGETFGLVGQTGSGKSTVGRMLVGLEEPTAGDVRFDGSSILGLSSSNMRTLRRRMQIVFQDPIGSLNRRKTVRSIIAFPLRVQGVEERDRIARTDELLEMVGLSQRLASRFPGELSGGQCQRVSIARALALEPEFIVLDEPVSSLDVSIQAQILNLLRELQSLLHLTYLFISHDLAIVRYMSDHVAVMRDGRVLEQGRRDEVFEHPSSQYTRDLLDAIPELPHH